MLISTYVMMEVWHWNLYPGHSIAIDSFVNKLPLLNFMPSYWSVLNRLMFLSPQLCLFLPLNSEHISLNFFSKYLQKRKWTAFDPCKKKIFMLQRMTSFLVIGVCNRTCCWVRNTMPRASVLKNEQWRGCFASPFSISTAVPFTTIYVRTRCRESALPSGIVLEADWPYFNGSNCIMSV